MSISVPNPYTGQDDQTCSVSFVAQQQMAAGTGSPQTEAQYNKSKILGEIGVMKGKLAKGQIPEGTKVFAYEGETGARGYYFVKGGKLKERSYGISGYQTSKEAHTSFASAEYLVESGKYKTSIPQSVAPNMKPKALTGQAAHDSIKKGLFKDGTLTPEQKSALEEYESGFYSSINSFLRKDQVVTSSFDKQAQKTIKILDEAMVDAELSTPIEVYRGMYNSTDLFGEDNFKGDLSGFSWQEKGYSSTTTNKAIADAYQIPDSNNHPKYHGTNVQMKVRVAAGVKALETSTWTQGSNANGPQAEVTLEHGTSWRVVKDNGFDENGVRQLEIEVFPLENPGAKSTGSATGGQGTSDQPAEQSKAASSGQAFVVASPTPLSAVNTGSDSVGSMSHEDVAAMFVKIKDDLAKEKGLAIKGANPALDEEVYKAIGNATGYTPTEVKAKIDAYKAAGNKLSALKKKVQAGTKKVPAGKPTQKAASGPIPLVPSAGTPKPDPKPHGVPTVATSTVTNKAKAEVKQEAAANPTKVYSEEDVAAAYIIAKDQVVAASNGKWTLYSKNDQLDLEIAIQVGLKTGMSPSQQKVAIANYLATGKKLSTLKKQLAKQGAFKPQADTLKKSGVEKTLADKEADVTAKANEGYTPTPTPATGTPPTDTGKPAPKRVEKETEEAGDISGFTQALKTDVYKEFKAFGDKAYFSSSEDSIYEAIAGVQLELKNYGKDLTLLQILRIIDEEGAKKFNAENGKIFEKKVATWLTTPAGTAHIKHAEVLIAKQAEQKKKKAEADKAAKELEGNQPPLPADSAQYQPWSLDKAKQVSKTWLDAKPWTARQKRDLKHYTGSSYVEMNGFLRGISSEISDRSENAIEGAKEGMRPTTEPILVQRGTGLDQFIDLEVSRGNGSSLWGITGKTFVDEGFLSTSAGGQAAFSGEAVLEIECPIGTPMAYVAPISNFPNENEMLLQAGMEYKILNVRKDATGRFVVRMRVVNWPGKQS